MKIKTYLTITFIILSSACLSFGQVEENPCTPNPDNPHVLDCAKNFSNDYPPVNPDGSVNIVIEIPAGTLEKWEVMDGGLLKHDMKNGKPRLIKYLGYPGNYGMIPKTLSGDNDPLDAIIIGAPPLPRGSVAHAKVIGVLKLIDNGESDDKIIAVLDGTDLYKVNNIDKLNKEFPGITKIIETWFKNYKGKGKMKSKGYGSLQKALNTINESIESYNKSSPK
jgi:inorganic pyrophosphatase